MASFLAGLTAIIAVLPELVSLIRQIGEATQAGVRFVDVRIKLARFDSAAKISETEKDTTKLETLFNPSSAGE